MHSNPTGDPRFFARCGPFSVAEVAAAANGTAAPSDLMLTGVAALDIAGPTEVSFLHDRRYGPALEATRAGAVIVPTGMAGRVPATAVAILADATYEGWARIALLFHPLPLRPPGIHPTAHIEPGATVHPTAEILAFTSVASGVTIGANTSVGPHASIAEGVQIGADCRIGAHTSVSHALIGDRVTLHPGVRLGQEGFSFAPTKTGFITIPQLGRVVVEDDVEIGANATIDRGSFQDTLIGAGTRIDNLVQIGHNVQLGRCCIIVAQVGISGSTILEDYVQVGGQAAFAGHIRIGARAQVGAQAGVIGDVPAGATMLGSPALPRTEFLRGIAILKKLARRQ